MVVDCVGFDVSIPKIAVKPLFKPLEFGKYPRLLEEMYEIGNIVLVANKVDLLTSQVSPTRLDRGVPQDASAG